MMSASAIDGAAQRLARGRLEGARLGALPQTSRPGDEAEAYAVQERLHAILSAAGKGRVAGHKIGCTTEVMQRYLKIESPCSGAIFDNQAHQGDGAFGHGDYQHLGVECEIAVSLAADLPSGHVYDRDSVGDAVRTVMAAIEVVNDRFIDYRSIDTPTMIADDFFAAGCVLGRPVSDWRELDLATLPGHMSIDGKEVGKGIGGDILGHPFTALAWLANRRAEAGLPLRAGEFVLLGSLVQTQWVEKGAVVEVEIAELGGAVARF
jgi:2-keto-4-pentenoate hydratase